jgi:hypothetical protein
VTGPTAHSYRCSRISSLHSYLVIYSGIPSISCYFRNATLLIIND